MKKAHFRTALAVSSAVILSAQLASAAAPFYQDFETDSSNINPRTYEGDPSNLVRTESGDGWIGAPSFSGGNHLEISFLDSEGFTGFGYGASWNDNAGAGVFSSGIRTGFSVYIDNPGQPEDQYWAGDGWFFQSTLMDTAGNNAISGGGFGVRMNSNQQWEIAATGSALGGFDYGLQFGAHPESGAATFSGDSTFIAAEGWYTFETGWYANATGGIDQVSLILDANGNQVYGVTIADVISDRTLAGTLGTAWIGQDGVQSEGEIGYSGNLVPDSFMADLAIDDVYVIPEPATVATIFGLVALGAAGYVRRRRQQA